jgi:hypothetical protein
MYVLASKFGNDKITKKDRFCVSPKVFPGSSVVEQLAVNQLVGGSNPSQGAIKIHQSPVTGIAYFLERYFITSLRS